MQLPPPIRQIRTGIKLVRTVITAPVDDGMTLLEKRRGTLYHLNRSGVVILTALIQAGGTVESAIAALVDQYGIGEDQAYPVLSRFCCSVGGMASVSLGESVCIPHPESPRLD